MKAYGGVDIYIQVLLTSALVGGEKSVSRLGRFTTGKKVPGIHWIGGLVNSKADLGDVEKRKFLPLTGLEHRRLGHPSRSQSPYRIRYPGSPTNAAGC
jgi:hypothetical protein